MTEFTGTSGADSMNSLIVYDSYKNYTYDPRTDDVFTPLGGNDTINGNDGTDTVVFQGNREDYLITAARYQVVVNDTVSGRDETDTLQNIEVFQFADCTIRSLEALINGTSTSDFDHDYKDELFWMSTNSAITKDLVMEIPDINSYMSIVSELNSYSSSNKDKMLSVFIGDYDSTARDANIMYIMNQAAGIQYSYEVADPYYDLRDYHPSTTVSVQWDATSSSRTYLGHGDTNADGAVDLFFQNAFTDELEILAGNVADYGTLGVLEDTWSLEGIGDMNGDGTTDLLFQDSADGSIFQYLVDGVELAATIELGAPGSNWKILDFHDFNGDGTSDILFRNQVTGDAVQWSLSAEGVTGHLFGNVGDNWKLQGAGDFDGDNREDLIWKNAETGMVVGWMMNGETSSGFVMAESMDSSFNFETVGDYNGDGRSDLIWRSSATNEVQAWFMEGTTVTARTVGYVGSDYTLVSN